MGDHASWGWLKLLRIAGAEFERLGGIADPDERTAIAAITASEKYSPIAGIP